MTAILEVRCPHCDYTDKGYDTDMIMLEFYKHKRECGGDQK